MTVWYCGKDINIELGQKVLIGSCGSGHSVFGEFGTLERATKNQLVFKTESGATVKTSKDNLHKVLGRAGSSHVFVSLNTDISDREFYKSPIECHIW